MVGPAPVHNYVGLAGRPTSVTASGGPGPAVRLVLQVLGRASDRGVQAMLVAGDVVTRLTRCHPLPLPS